MGKYTDSEVERLASAVWQLLDDMGRSGHSVCEAAKAEARAAYEPFRDKSEPEFEDWMTLSDAHKVISNL